MRRAVDWSMVLGVVCLCQVGESGREESDAEATARTRLLPKAARGSDDAQGAAFLVSPRPPGPASIEVEVLSCRACSGGSPLTVWPRAHIEPGAQRRAADRPSQASGDGAGLTSSIARRRSRVHDSE